MAHIVLFENRILRSVIASSCKRGEAIPASGILNRIAKALDVTTDFLMIGTQQDKLAEAISDGELLSQFRKTEKLPAEKTNSSKSDWNAHL